MIAPGIYAPGVKVLEVKTAREDARAEAVLEAVRARMEPYVRRSYATILRAQLRAVRDLAHIPSERETEAILAESRQAQLRVLMTLMERMYPDASTLAVPDRSLKADGRRLEVKAELAETDALYRWIRENLGIHIDAIDATTLRQIQDAAVRSLDPEEFRLRVDAIINRTAYRAYVIARTETASASNASMAIAAETYSFGRSMTKTWRTYGGSTVRPTHREMDRVTIPRDQLFQVPRPKGGVDLMDFPADQSHGASAANVVNCRCRCTYAYDD